MIIMYINWFNIKEKFRATSAVKKLKNNNILIKSDDDFNKDKVYNLINNDDETNEYENNLIKSLYYDVLRITLKENHSRRLKMTVNVS